MKKIGRCGLFSLLVLLLSPCLSQASFLHAPHTSLNNVGCKDCHEYSFAGGVWPPNFPPSLPSADDSIKNFVCLKCHGASNIGPRKALHSSLSLKGIYPNWTTECVTCHDPHFQSQLEWIKTDSASLYLVTGTISAMDSTTMAGQTKVTFTTGAAKANWASAAKWSAKTGAGRGLIFVPDKSNPSAIYEILSATYTSGNGTITVQGTVAATGIQLGVTQFGVIYGQMIRNRVRYNSGYPAPYVPTDRRIKFFDSFDGFVDLVSKLPDDPPTGICQACHTKTLYWKTDGKVPTNHEAGDCSVCHPRMHGFPTTPPEPPSTTPPHKPFGSPPPPCTDCHTQPYTVHMDNMRAHALCSPCHPSGTVDEMIVMHDNPTYPATTRQCVMCHISTRQQVINAIYAGYGPTGQPQDCTNCHGVKNTKYHADPPTSTEHNMLVATASCATCHPSANVGAIHAMHRNDCMLCHGSAWAEVKTAISNGLQNLQVTCAACHPTYAADYVNHKVKDHNGVTGTASCRTCHKEADMIVGTHKNLCASCHAPITGVFVAKTFGTATVGSGDCVKCHSLPAYNYGANYTNHAVKDHNGVTGTASCRTCHKEADMIVGTHKNLCASCHAPITGVFVAKTYGTATVGSGDCVKCHSLPAYNYGANYTNHAVKDHNGVTGTSGATPTTNCIGCHSSPNIIGVIHNNNCALCHASITGVFVTKPLGTAVGGSGDCKSCHNAYFNGHVHSPHTVAQKTTDLSDGTLCSACHNDSGGKLVTWADISTEHLNSCVLCHDAKRDVNPRTPTGTTVQNVITLGANPTGCLDCHADKTSHANIDHLAQGRVTATAACVSCHDPTGIGTDSYYINTMHNISGKGCGICHVNPAGSGPLHEPWETTSPAGGTCAVCHPAYATNYTNHKVKDHNGVTGTASCRSCHKEADMIVGTHKNLCASCHAPITGVFVAKTYGTATVGSGDCVKCHSLPAYNYGANYINHAVKDHNGVTGTASCRTCHNEADMIVGTHKNLCASCHAPITGVFVAKTYGTATLGSGDCVKCHSLPAYNYGANYTNHAVKDHNGVTGTASCRTCHNETDMIVGTHKNLCASCHAPITGVFVAKTYGTATVGSGDCVKCHSLPAYNYGANYTNHAVKDHNGVTGTSGATPTTNCNGCHGSPNIIGVIHNNNCALCHTPITGVYVKKPNGDATGGSGDCKSCHSAYFNGHVHTPHTVAQTATDLTAGTPCGNCHNDSGGNLATWAAISTEHLNSCTLCHDATRDVNPKAPTGTTVQQVIALGANPTGCLKCHADKSATHGVTVDHTPYLSDTPACVTCHYANKPMLVHLNKCEACHTTAPLLATPATRKYVTAITRGQCTTCHTAYFDGHIHVHAISEGTGDQAQNPAQKCSECHGGVDHIVTGWSEIMTMHNNSCALCHQSARQEVKDAIALGAAPTNCLDCHSVKKAPASHTGHPYIKPGHRGSPYLGTLTCFKAGCHMSNTAEEHLTPNGIGYQRLKSMGKSFSCTYCHQYQPVRPGMKFHDDPVINSAISTGVNLDQDVYCSDCHKYGLGRLDISGLPYSVSVKYGDPNYMLGKVHHDKAPQVRAGNCTACHIDPRLNPYGTGKSLTAPKMLPCKVCHTLASPTGGTYGTGQMTIYKSRTGSQIDPYNGTVSWNWRFTGPIANTDPVSQTGLKHQWNVDGGMIQDFGVCLFCHKMRPYHAYNGPPANDANMGQINLVTDPPHYVGNGRGTLNVFFAKHRKAFQYYKGAGQSTYKNTYKAIRDKDAIPLPDITWWANVTYDPQTDPTGMVPTTAFCSSPAYTTKNQCEANGHWWRPAHVMKTPEYFAVPTFDTPAGGDTVIISNARFDNKTFNITVDATNTATTQGYLLHAIYLGKNYPMTKTAPGVWTCTITTGLTLNVSDKVGRVYVISVDPANNQRVLSQAYRDL